MAEIIQTQSGHKLAKIRSKKLTAHVDMTPMVDLAFLLLTFFILTTTLNKLMVIEIEVPEKVADPDPRPINESHVLTLVLDEKDKVYWRQGMHDAFKRIDYSQIKKLLMEKKQEIDRLALFVKSTNKSRYQNFVDIMDNIDATEIWPYYVVDAEREDERLISEVDQ